MRREVSWGLAALEEFGKACDYWAEKAPVRGVDLLESVDAVVLSLQQFPLQGLEVETGLPYSVRRFRVRGFSFVLSYTVFPSVDFQTGEALDVIYVLACRHERQNEPNWQSRDPFRL